MDSTIGKYIPQVKQEAVLDKASSAKSIDGLEEKKQLQRVLERFNKTSLVSIRVEQFENASIPAEAYDKLLEYLAKDASNGDSLFVIKTILAANNILDADIAQGLKKIQNVVFVAAILERIQKKQDISDAQWLRMDAIAKDVAFTLPAGSENEVLELQSKIALPVVVDTSALSKEIALVQSVLSKIEAGQKVEVGGQFVHSSLDERRVGKVLYRVQVKAWANTFRVGSPFNARRPIGEHGCPDFRRAEQTGEVSHEIARRHVLQMRHAVE